MLPLRTAQCKPWTCLMKAELTYVNCLLPIYLSCPLSFPSTHFPIFPLFQQNKKEPCKHTEEFTKIMLYVSSRIKIHFSLKWYTQYHLFSYILLLRNTYASRSCLISPTNMVVLEGRAKTQYYVKTGLRLLLITVSCQPSGHDRD